MRKFAHLRTCLRTYGYRPSAIGHFLLERYYALRLSHAIPIKLRYHLISTLIDWVNWQRYYLPPASLNANDLILDGGSGEGETIYFFYRLGFRNFRAVECDAAKAQLARENAKRLKGIKVEVINDYLKPEHLCGATFAKIDVEGGEKALLNGCKLPAMVVETHGRKLYNAYTAMGFTPITGYNRNCAILRNFQWRQQKK